MSRGKGTSGFSPVSTIGMLAFFISFSTNPVQMAKEGCIKTSMYNPLIFCAGCFTESGKKIIKITISVRFACCCKEFKLHYVFVCTSVQRSQESVE